ncbi:MAG: hypothetical protein DCF25_15250 [Leptolyngbya foveolarum]|uniref:YqhA family protein n=1 Tax=Leptolyngbya foveolarum TaxID=47253 RepID=A0A2W4U4I6_9CYAN|nr:MAG: hypothetical protein DCF25_15250 [Leptolyngbya foveolarum]
MRQLRKIEHVFETIIWNFRLLVLFPVIFSLLSAVKFFMIGTWDIWAGLSIRFDPADPEGENTYQIVSYVIGGIDYYLIGIVLLIFAFGIYELFISRIDIRFEQEVSILQSESLDELKSKLVKVIVVALIVNLFKKMLELEISQASDFVYVALTIFLIAISNYLLQVHTQSPLKPIIDELRAGDDSRQI